MDTSFEVPWHIFLLRLIVKPWSRSPSRNSEILLRAMHGHIVKSVKWDSFWSFSYFETPWNSLCRGSENSQRKLRIFFSGRCMYKWVPYKVDVFRVDEDSAGICIRDNARRDGAGGGVGRACSRNWPPQNLCPPKGWRKDFARISLPASGVGPTGNQSCNILPFWQNAKVSQHGNPQRTATYTQPATSGAWIRKKIIYAEMPDKKRLA
jgi:hypothetical protein